MRINNENFNRAWTRSQESQSFNFWIIFFFSIGLIIGICLGYWVYSKKLIEQAETIEKQERLIELLEE